MRVTTSQVRNVVLTYFAALGLTKASGDLLTVIGLEPSKSNDYLWALLLMVFVGGLIYWQRKSVSSKEGNIKSEKQ